MRRRRRGVASARASRSGAARPHPLSLPSSASTSTSCAPSASSSAHNEQRPQPHQQAGGQAMKGDGGGGGGGFFGGGPCSDDDVFTPAPAKLRPTMISAKYRLKEERRKVLKMSIAKLRKIEDPESSLRRSVLINNTMKRLQREAREEKLAKQFPNARPASTTTSTSTPSANHRPRLGKENVSSTSTNSSTSSSRKRPFDDVDDCDVQDVLSQFYMPPTPRMLTSIDDVDDEEEAELNVVDCDVPSVASVPTVATAPVPAISSDVSASPPAAKRARLDSAEDTSVESADVDMTLALHAAGLATRVSETPATPAAETPAPRLFWPGTTTTTPAASAAATPAADTPDQHFSCGHSSLFGEIQSVVYHSLIASLES